jgi:hypothetical protein
MVMKPKYNFSEICYNDIMELIIDLLLPNHKMLENLYQSKKVDLGLGMNYEKIDACGNNCMLFWRDHENVTNCMHYDKSRYAVVVDEEGTEVTTKVPDKQFWYMPITPCLERLFLNQETTKKMRWHKEEDRQD